MESEYLKYQDSKDSMSLNISGSSLNQSTQLSENDSNKSIDLEYSKYGAKTLKKHLSKKRKTNLDKYDNLAEGFKSVNRRDIGRYHNYDNLTRNTIFFIIFLAMNQINCEHQLGDMIRYIREGHLTYYDISKFFPENIDITKIQNYYRQISLSIPSHNHFRFELTSLAKLLNVHMQLPDISKLCKRYVEELELPNDIYRLIEILLAIYPPEMEIKSYQSKRTPNYEGRAMAYIIFILKYLFGLDDDREERISESAQNINANISNVDDKEIKSLFIWSEWVKYIEMRNILLSKCHYPSAMVHNPNSEHNTHLYMDYMLKFVFNDEQKCQVKSAKNIAIMSNIHEIFKEINLMDKNELKKPSLFFNPSLTPQRSYFENILEIQSLPTLHIPKFMYEKHYNRNIMPFLQPSKLKLSLKKYNIGLLVNEHAYSQKLTFESVYRNERVFQKTVQAKKSVNIEFDINEKEWIKIVQNKNKNEKFQKDEKDKINSVDSMEDIIKKELEKIQRQNQQIKMNRQKLKMSKSANLQETPKFTNDRSTKTSNNDNAPTIDNTSISDIFSMASNEYLDIIGPEFHDIDNVTSIFNCIDDDDDHEEDQDNINDTEAYSTLLTLDISNYDYWLTIGNLSNIHYEQFDDILNKLPKNFQWLLKQCAQMIENKPRELYEQLIILENCYAHILEPLNTISNNMVGLQDIKKYKNLDSRLYRAIRSIAWNW